MKNFEAHHLVILQKFLKKRLKEALPGREAQYKMTGLRRNEHIFDRKDMSKARLSSVLILLYPDAGQIKLVLIRRSEYDGVHSGQLSFPGGSKEKEDTEMINTALRESYEETRILPDDVSIIGQLSELFIPPSNFVVTPVIGCSAKRPDFVADPVEVAEIIEIPLVDLVNPESIKHKMVTAGLRTLEVPCYFINNNIIWGATAMILGELIEILNEFNPYSTDIE